MQSKAFLQTAASLAPHMYEPHFNLSILSEKVIIYFKYKETVFLCYGLHTLNKCLTVTNV